MSLFTPPSAIQTYDPSANFRIPTAAVLRVRAITDCTVRLQIDRLDGLGELRLTGVDPAALRVQLSQDASGTAPLQATPFDTASWTLLAGQTVAYSIWISPLPQQWVSAGLYQSPLRFRLLDSNGSTLDQRDWLLSMQAQATAKVSFTGMGARVARLDFGEISANARRSAGLDVWANSGYQIKLSSQNRGFMQNKQASVAGRDSQIPYSVNLAGQNLSLASGDASLQSQGNGNLRYQLDVTLGEVQRLLAGEYADDLLITVIAQ